MWGKLADTLLFIISNVTIKTNDPFKTVHNIVNPALHFSFKISYRVYYLKQTRNNDQLDFLNTSHLKTEYRIVII